MYYHTVMWSQVLHLGDWARGNNSPQKDSLLRNVTQGFRLTGSCEHCNEPSGSKEMRVNFLTEWLLASQERLCSMELVSYWESITASLEAVCLSITAKFRSWPSGLWHRVVIWYESMRPKLRRHSDGCSKVLQKLVSYHITKRRQNPEDHNLNLPWKPQISYHYGI